MSNAGCKTKISIALCTFDGAAFLEEQLASLASQSRPPDELIAFDDGSTDSSLELIADFAKRVSFPVTTRQNATRLGPAQNFSAAFSACTGDIIACCDQDDIWHSSKLAMIEAAFQQSPRPGIVFSNAEMCGANGQSLGYTLWNSVGLNAAQLLRIRSGGAFEVLLRQNVVTGATMAFDAKYRSLLLPIEVGWMHDGWIALLIAAVAPALAINQTLIEYRQHANQSIGAERRSLYQQYVNARKMDRNVFNEQADQFEAALARLQEQTDFDVPPGVIHLMQEKIAHCRRRSAIRLGSSGRVVPSLVELITQRYRRFSLGWKSFGQDLFL